MANIGRKFLTDHGVPDEQLDAIMNEINTTISNRLTGYVAQSDVQAQIDAALKAVPKPEPIDPKTTPEYQELQRERDMLRTIGGDDFAPVLPKYREYLYGKLDRGEKAKPIPEQITELRGQFGEMYFPEKEPPKDQPKNTPQYSQQPGRPGVNPTSAEEQEYQKAIGAWK